MRKTIYSAPTEQMVFCLLRHCPKPRRTLCRVLETLDKFSGCAIRGIAFCPSNPDNKKGLIIVSIDFPVFLCYDVENERRCLPCRRYSFWKMIPLWETVFVWRCKAPPLRSSPSCWRFPFSPCWAMSFQQLCTAMPRSTALLNGYGKWKPDYTATHAFKPKKSLRRNDFFPRFWEGWYRYIWKPKIGFYMRRKLTFRHQKSVL